MRASAYWPTNWATPRTKKTPRIARGTIHSCKVPWVKPLSSRGCNRAGIKGSVMAPTSVATMARLQAIRWSPKYTDSRFRRAIKVVGGLGAGAGVVPVSVACMSAGFYVCAM